MKINYDINTDHHDEPDRELKVVYRNGKKVWPPEDPIDVYEAMAKRFDHIENELRSMRAELADIIRDAIVQPNTYVYKPTAPTIVNEESKPCSTCEHCEHYSTAVQRCLLVSCEYKPAKVAWVDIPDPCKHCSTHPSNGGSGNCNCTLGTPKIDCSWK